MSPPSLSLPPSLSSPSLPLSFPPFVPPFLPLLSLPPPPPPPPSLQIPLWKKQLKSVFGVQFVRCCGVETSSVDVPMPSSLQPNTPMVRGWCFKWVCHQASPSPPLPSPLLSSLCRHQSEGSSRGAGRPRVVHLTTFMARPSMPQCPSHQSQKRKYHALLARQKKWRQPCYINECSRTA